MLRMLLGLALGTAAGHTHPSEAPVSVQAASARLDAGDCAGLDRLAHAASALGRDSLELAEVLRRGSVRCEPSDRVLALGLSERALALAPQAPGIRLRHAELLLATEQRAEATGLLDKLILESPDAPEGREARLLRAAAANDDRDFATAARVLQPVVQDAVVGERARAMLAVAEAEAPSSAGRPMPAQEGSAPKAEPPSPSASAPTAEPPRHSGELVWSAEGSVHNGQSRSFPTHGLHRGERYLLTATGSCTPPKGMRRGGRRKGRGGLPPPRPDAFGTDFKATVGSLEPMSLNVGADRPEETRIPFQAKEDDPVIRVEDRTLSTPNMRCTVGGLAVKVP